MEGNKAANQDTVESLLENMGGCGMFQILIVIFVHGSSLVAAWVSLFMSFGSYNPGWTCSDSNTTLTSYLLQNHTKNGSASCDDYNKCKHVHFDNDSSTIVTEWDLACNRSWIVSMMISLHMGGAVIGAVLSGHLNHYIGRKITIYSTLLLMAASNTLASFATSWPFYAAMRFILGFLTGALYLSAYVYPVEFVISRWRGPFMAIPAVNVGYLLFAVAAYISRDWRQLHLATAAFAVLWCIPAFWVPESLRWLVVRGKTKGAYKVAEKIAKTNSSSMPNTDIIQTVADRERERIRKRTVYSIHDLFRHGLFYRTFTVTFAWVSFTVIYYVIMYGVKNLSGNFYINLMIFAFVTTASYPFVPILSNFIGRKWGMIVLLIVSILSCTGLVVIHFLREHLNKDLLTTILSLLLLTCVDGAWALLILHLVELYPTVLRSISYSHSSCWGGLGGVVAPFLIPEDQRSSYKSHIVMGCLALVSVILLFFLPETKGKHMAELIKLRRTSTIKIEEDNTTCNEDTSKT